MDVADRLENGLKGREWALSEESGFTSQRMTQGIIDGIDKTIEKFAPRTPFDLIEVKPKEPRYVEHKLTGY